jgi:hypothetical protein
MCRPHGEARGLHAEAFDPTDAADPFAGTTLAELLLGRRRPLRSAAAS